jgi:hypothetical protein
MAKNLIFSYVIQVLARFMTQMRWVALPDARLLLKRTATQAGLASHPEKDFC